MNSNIRTTFICSVTVNHKHYDAINEYVGNELSKEFGGATTYQGSGFWSENGHEDLDAYSDNIEQCRVLITRLSVMPTLESKALDTLKRVFKDINEQFELNNTFLHVEKTSTMAHHIQL